MSQNCTTTKALHSSTPFLRCHTEAESSLQHNGGLHTHVTHRLSY